MRAIYTTWTQRDRPAAGVEARSGRRVRQPGLQSRFALGARRLVLPRRRPADGQGRHSDAFFLRPPHWAPREQVRAFRGSQPVPVVWSGSYVRFDGVRPGDELTIVYPLVRFSHEVQGLWGGRPQLRLKFEWLGNMVTSVDPPATKTPLFSGARTSFPPLPPELIPGRDN